ncbi:hypothetical protein XELAEV_18040870mg [Xenopus laevis]|uniref:Uncharacterized protein n=1 Tax=Xenopus laevis TaxID=8355 RepID=A0A974H9A8_XENLA|nr:hypothetical protein XELAEV_18040870mg [Xenopus laevis]
MYLLCLLSAPSLIYVPPLPPLCFFPDLCTSSASCLLLPWSMYLLCLLFAPSLVYVPPLPPLCSFPDLCTSSASSLLLPWSMYLQCLLSAPSLVYVPHLPPLFSFPDVCTSFAFHSSPSLTYVSPASSPVLPSLSIQITPIWLSVSTVSWLQVKRKTIPP